jgi:TPR repeat protein
VAKALTALAGYLQRGVAEIGVRPDPARAVEYLQYAATFFGDKDAQFELAKHYLSGSGSSEDIKRGKHYLSVLSEEGHPGAQALLADLFWRGKYVAKDERQALGLITVAVENAPAHERIWIEDIYHNIFCGTSQGTRKQADGFVARWRKIFSRPAAGSERSAPARDVQPERTCGNGELVDINRAAPAAPGPNAPAMQGSTVGFGLRDAGAVERTR